MTDLIPAAAVDAAKALLAPITDEDLIAMDTRAARASDGPWTFPKGAIVNERGECQYGSFDDRRKDTAYYGGQLICESVGGADREFIAAARFDVPRLVREVRRLRHVNAELREVIAGGDRCPHMVAPIQGDIRFARLFAPSRRCGLRAGHEGPHRG